MFKKFLFCLLILFAGSMVQASDLYWISFLHHGVDDVFLMQIDQFGNVTVAPKDIMDFHSHSTAMASIAGNKLLVWANDGDIDRVTVDKATLAFSSLKRVAHSNDSNALQVTQGVGGFFLAYEANGDVLKGFFLNSKGNFSGTSFRLSPRTDGNMANGGVSADGLMAFAKAPGPNDKLYIQPLSNGHPVGDPVIVANGEIDSADISNPLSGGIRFVVYQNDGSRQIMLQPIDSVTAAKKGTVKVLAAADPDHSDQMIAIDPLGRFLIFSDDAQGCNVSSMYYQALDVMGNASGSRKELVGCAFQNQIGDIHGIRAFDILKN